MSRFQALSLPIPASAEPLRGMFAAARRAIAGYALALLFVGGALAATFVLEDILGVQHLRFLLYAAVAASAWFGGAGPGCMSVVLCTMGVEYLFMPPLYTLAIYPNELPELLTFIACAAVSLAVSARLARAEQALYKAHQGLEATVTERTAELREANAALTVEIAERERADREREASEVELAETQAQLARVLRIATVAECAAVAHEVNQPLTAIVANASACLRSLERDPPALDLARDAVSGIVSDGRRASAVISRIGALLRNRKPVIAPLDLNGVIRDVLALVRGTAEKDGVAIRTSLSRSLPTAAGDPVYLQQVLLNLITNAFESMRAVEGRQRGLAVRSRLDAAGFVLVEVEDSGAGLAGVDTDRLFESFYTTKSEGLGMGLSISHSIIAAHGGRLWASPGRRHGAVFRFTLPVAPATDQ